MIETRNDLLARRCVNPDDWANAFLASDAPKDHHEVSLWLSDCLTVGFMIGQKEFSSQQDRHLQNSASF